MVASKDFRPAEIHLEQLLPPCFGLTFCSSPQQTNNNLSALRPNLAHASVALSKSVLPEVTSRSLLSIALAIAPWVAAFKAAKPPVNFLAFLILLAGKAHTKQAVTADI